MTAMTLGDHRPVCAFCLVNRTTAVLHDNTPICWRPCYTALTRVQAGQPPRRAITQAFEDLPGGMTLARQMVEDGLDVDALCVVILERVARGQVAGMNPGALGLTSAGRAMLALAEGGGA